MPKNISVYSHLISSFTNSIARATDLNVLIFHHVCLGHEVKYIPSSFFENLFATSSEISVFRPDRIVLMMRTALGFFTNISPWSGHIMLIDSHPNLEHALMPLLLKFQQPFNLIGWVGGLLTNVRYFIEARLSGIMRFRDRNSNKKNSFSKLPTGLKLKFLRQAIFRREDACCYYSSRVFTRLPKVVFISSYSRAALGALESIRCGIPSVGLVDSDTSGFGLTYPLIGNDDSIYSLLLHYSILFHFQERVKLTRSLSYVADCNRSAISVFVNFS